MQLIDQMIKTQNHCNNSLIKGKNKQKSDILVKSKSQYLNDYHINAMTGEDVFAIKSKLNNIISTINQKMIVRIRSKEKRLISDDINNQNSSLALMEQKMIENERRIKTRNQLIEFSNSLFSNHKIGDTNAITNQEIQIRTEPEIILNDNQIRNYNKEYRDIIYSLLLNENNNDNANKHKLYLKYILDYIAGKDLEIDQLKNQLKDYESIISFKDKELKLANDKINVLLKTINNNHNSNKTCSDKPKKLKRILVNKSKAKVYIK